MSFADSMRTHIMHSIRVGWCVVIITGSIRTGYTVSISNPDRTMPSLEEREQYALTNYADAFRKYAEIISVMNRDFLFN